MKTELAIRPLPQECFVLKLDGRIKSQHRRLTDALRAGLALRDQFPQHTVKVAVLRQPTIH
jgi:hypothetical protein